MNYYFTRKYQRRSSWWIMRRKSWWGADTDDLRSVVNRKAQKVELPVANWIERFLGISIIMRMAGRIKIYSPLLVESITQRFNMAGAKSTPTSIATSNRIEKDEEGDTTEAPYKEFISTLLYPAYKIRPHTYVAVERLRIIRFRSKPKESHWTAAKKVVK